MAAKLPTVTPKARKLASGTPIGKATTKGKDRAWWAKPEGDKHDSLIGAFDAAYNGAAESSRRQRWRRYLQLYGGAEAYAFNSDWMRAAGRTTSGPIDGWTSGTRLSLNVVRNMVNAAQARICKSQPKPQFLTDDGNFALQRRAEGCGHFSQGMFAENKVPKLMPLVMRDAMIGDGGAIRVLTRHGRVKFERIFPWHVVLNSEEAERGEDHLRNWYVWDLVDREVLRERYLGKDKDPRALGGSDRATLSDALDNAQAVQLQDSMIMRDPLSDASDLIPVVSAWHMGPSPDVPGCWAEAIPGATLSDVPWKRARPPVLVTRYAEPTYGVWGNGISEDLLGLQLEINYLVRSMQRAHHKVGKPFVMVPRGTKIAQGTWTNEIASFVEYDGPTAPSVMVFAVVPPEMYAQLKWYIDQAAALTGNSQSFATAEKPAGLDSGKALRTYHDIDSQRLAMPSRNYEQAHIDLNELGLDEVRELAESGAYQVNFRGAQGLKPVDWKRIALEREQYEIQVFPANALSDTPAERLEDAQNLMDAGLITDRAQMLDLLQFPDTRAATSLETAGYDLARSQIARILDGADDVTIDPLQDVDTAHRIGLASYQKLSQQSHVPPAVGEALREYVLRADDMIQKRKAEAMKLAPPSPMGMPPGAPPPMPPDAMSPPPDGAPVAPPMGVAA